ncbi:MAG: hypothetical protein R3Y11_04205 [Pseudomonadota bacterium]
MSEKVFISVYSTIIALFLFFVPVGGPHSSGGFYKTHYCFIASIPTDYPYEIIIMQWLVPLLFVAVAGAVIYYVKYMKK